MMKWQIESRVTARFSWRHHRKLALMLELRACDLLNAMQKRWDLYNYTITNASTNDWSIELGEMSAPFKISIRGWLVHIEPKDLAGS